MHQSDISLNNQAGLKKCGVLYTHCFYIAYIYIIYQIRASGDIKGIGSPIVLEKNANVQLVTELTPVTAHLCCWGIPSLGPFWCAYGRKSHPPYLHQTYPQQRPRVVVESPAQNLRTTIYHSDDVMITAKPATCEPQV